MRDVFDYRDVSDIIGRRVAISACSSGDPISIMAAAW
jgi:hypothetical protein